MAYTPTTWTDNTTEANAARLNKLEQGVKEAHDLAEAGTSGTVPIFGSQAEALAWEAANPGQAALWFDGAGAVEPDPDDIEVVPFGPTWTDNTTTGGGTWTTPTETGVTYSPASGTATPSQTVTVTATAQAGYYISGGSTWTHTFPDAAGATWPMYDEFDREVASTNTDIGPADTGQTYTLVGAGAFTISAIPSGTYVGEGKLNASLGAGARLAVVDAEQADVLVKAVVQHKAAGVVARADGTTFDGYYLQRRVNTSLRLFKEVGGVYTHLTPDITGVFASDTEPKEIALRCQGSTITCYVEGVQVHQVTDTSLPSGTYAGAAFGSPGGDLFNLSIERL